MRSSQKKLRHNWQNITSYTYIKKYNFLLEIGWKKKSHNQLTNELKQLSRKTSRVLLFVIPESRRDDISDLYCDMSSPTLRCLCNV